MPMGDEVTQWIERLGGGDQRAAEVIWEKYFTRLVHFAQRKLQASPARDADEEDVALSAMHSFCRGLRAGRFAKVEDRHDLWKLLLTITARKATALRRRQHAAKRGGGHLRGESAFGPADGSRDDLGIGQVLGTEPTPEFAAMVAENTRGLLEALQDPTLRSVAQQKLEGYTTEEIAANLGCVRRSVERKLERIREKWSREVPS